MPTTFGADTVRNGFKDVFTGGAVKTLTYDDIEYIDKEENIVQTRASVEQDGRSSLERKLKVGNKKTDKFFGESLSDHLSDEPVDESSTVDDKDEPDRSSSSDKKLFFLMNMLDREHDDDERYKDREPVEEPLFIAKKKEIKKHICDDDDHMHNKFNHHHDKNEPCEHKHDSDHEHAVAPPKPDRDFSKYQNVIDAIHQPTFDVVKEKVAESHSKARVNRAISRENLPTPPATPKRKSGVHSSPAETPTITIDSTDFNTEANESRRPSSLKLSQDNEIDDNNDPPPPTTPILAHDLVDRMIKKAYGFHDYHPEDLTEHNHDDGSSLVAPKSKLTTRKISVTRKVSTNSAPSIDGDELVPPGDADTSPPKSPKKGRDFEKMIQASSINDIIDEIYSKNSEIMQEFQSYLEKSVEATPVINVDAEKAFLKTQGITNDEFSRTPEPVKLPDVEDEVEDTQSYSDSFESSDTEQETITEMKHVSSIPKYLGRRRESIEDVDNWFNKHLDLEETKSQTCGVQDNAPPGVSTYDTSKIFPFGRTIIGRRDSLSDEFFTQLPSQQISLMKPEIGTLRESESSTSDADEADKSRRDSSRQKSPDHSSLLKFLEQESRVN